jgi:hypothetical protein
MDRHEQTKRDNILVALLKEHKGAEQIISSKEIAKYLNSKGWATKIGCVHSLVKKVMYERTLPICSDNAKGYFWAQSKDELISAITELQSRITELQRRIEHLNAFIIE